MSFSSTHSRRSGVARSVAALVASLAVAVPAALLATAAPASAATRIGGVNVQNFCDKTYGVGTTRASWSNYSDPFGWGCNYRSATGLFDWYRWGGVDMNKACVLQYGRGAYAGLAARNVMGWYCQR
ncbi:MAG: hypothetical protein KGN78_13615 [Actinomycetales bacterium]|nr:hypothetical protein [Actinomycetales bacterium]